MALHEYTGVIHAHSTHSDGSGTVEEIISAAQEAGIDFLVLTDHNTLEAREMGHEGWHDTTLLIVGDEVSSRDGHCLALGTREHVNHRQNLPRILEGIRETGGHGYVAHPHGRYRPILKTRDHSWKDWSADDITGLELWSYMFDWASGFHYIRFPRYYRDPDACLRGPDPETVAKWDELCQSRRVVALGGVDAHARKLPLLPVVVFPYCQLFRTIRTHVLSEQPLKHRADKDIDTILGAIADGSCFLALGGLADAGGTRFTGRDGELSMGAEATFEQPVELDIRVPVSTDITLLKDGSPIRTQTGKSMRHTVDRPGVYRAEARLGNRPWLYTNPIYLRRHPSDQTNL